MAAAIDGFSLNLVRAMLKYKNLSRHSGVVAYRPGRDSIDVAFENGAIYRYTVASAGRQHIEQMKALAAAGRGLSTYIVREVRQRFAAKLR